MKHVLSDLGNAIEQLIKAKSTVQICLEVYDQEEKMKDIDNALILLNECYEMIADNCEGEE